MAEKDASKKTEGGKPAKRAWKAPSVTVLTVDATRVGPVSGIEETPSTGPTS